MYNRFEEDYALLDKCRTHLDDPQTHPIQLLTSAGICVREGFLLMSEPVTDIRQQLISIEYLTLALELYLTSYKKLDNRTCKECFEGLSRKLLLMLDESDERHAKVEQLIAEYNQIKNA